MLVVTLLIKWSKTQNISVPQIIARCGGTGHKFQTWKAETGRTQCLLPTSSVQHDPGQPGLHDKDHLSVCLLVFFLAFFFFCLFIS